MPYYRFSCSVSIFLWQNKIQLFNLLDNFHLYWKLFIVCWSRTSHFMSFRYSACYFSNFLKCAINISSRKIRFFPDFFSMSIANIGNLLPLQAFVEFPPPIVDVICEFFISAIELDFISKPIKLFERKIWH